MSDRFYALTIAGGRGERLRPLTDDRPKPMVDLNGRPMIAYQVDWMRSQGVTDVVFLVGYMGEIIRDYFGDGSEQGITAHYSSEDSPLGRGGALKQGLSQVPADANKVLVLNGDVITNQPLGPMLKLHESSGATGTIMLVPHPSDSTWIESDEKNAVTRFSEKKNLPFWINGGVYLFDRSIESLLPDIGDHETTTFQDLVKNGKLSALRSDEAWTSIDSLEELTEVADQIRSGYLEFTTV